MMPISTSLITSGWVKRFSDGKEEVGSDYEVANKRASWTKGRLDNILSVELHHNGHILIIEGIGEFWQSDDLEVSVGINHSNNLVTRRIQKKIEKTDYWLLLNSLDKYKHYTLCIIKPPDTNYTHCWRMDNYQDQWFTVELDVKHNISIFDFKENKI